MDCQDISLWESKCVWANEDDSVVSQNLSGCVLTEELEYIWEMTLSKERRGETHLV